MIAFLLTSWWSLFILVLALVYSAKVVREAEQSIGAKVVFGLVLLAHIGVFVLGHKIGSEARPWGFVIIQWYTTAIVGLLILGTIKALAEWAIERNNRKNFNESLIISQAQLYRDTAYYARVLHSYIRQNTSTTITIKDMEEALFLLRDSFSLARSGREQAFMLLRSAYTVALKRDNPSLIERE